MSGYEFEGVDSHEDAVRISGRIKWFDVRYLPRELKSSDLGV